MSEVKMQPILGYESEYLVTNEGAVYSIRSEKFLKPSVNEKGYMRVCLQKGGIKSWKRVHRLVAETFLRNDMQKETVNHINGNRSDNRVENLEWATMLEQNQDERRSKRASETMRNHDSIIKKMRPVTQKDLNGNVICVHRSLNDAARFVGTSVGNIYSCCNGKRRYSKGFSFEYT